MGSYINLSGYQIPKNEFDKMCPFERHKLMMSLRMLEKNKNVNCEYLTDYDILKKKYKFIHDVSKENNSLLQNYYSSICNKYVICDLSKYKEAKIGLRWRTEEEIIKGKGHIICCSKKCDNTNLNTYEFLFQYVEEGIEKKTKVKVRACMDCAYKLHYRKIKKYLKKKKKKNKQKEKKIKHRRTSSSNECSNTSSSLNDNRSKSNKKELYYIKKKLEKISLKAQEKKNEENMYFHDLIF
ncbi:conserved protein, unknown function [Plasmodium yoelii]|uniref:Protein FRA10AC1 n=3 Tax=Plasmodium yoelii TaxID=5861 RepID=A0AAF0B6G4_PLAYO|nr:conserved protein, unknown function [Plasmodium yoelii]WBY59294.1 hypothetical protein Py17XNL_001205138 [Plasmodium yoelii yoelii]CDU19446.1 conserved protein, unknown function [Plasmodium yoelii]VTZ80081.1 conserved protein, unknown function [Plasmodium yoelii]|eukprot:XP_022812660.1 conserved protein, unknown function [Plasmodium yoelii]